VTAIWIGYDLQRRIMNNAGGGRIVAPAWTKFMRDVYERRLAPGDWARPDDLVTREVDGRTDSSPRRSAPSSDDRQAAVETCDVVAGELPPGVLEKWGLGWGAARDQSADL